MLKRVEKNYTTSYSSSVSEANTTSSFAKLKSLSSDPSAIGAACKFSCSPKNELSPYVSLSIASNSSQAASYTLTVFFRMVDTNSLAAASSEPKRTHLSQNLWTIPSPLSH